MADISQVLAEEKLYFQEFVFIITPPTFETRAAYTQFLERSAIAFVRRHKADYGDDYLAALDRVGRKGGAKGYAWGSEAWAESTANDECLQELALAVLAQSNKRVTRQLVMALWEASGGKVVNKDTGDEDDATVGAELVQKLFRLINRPNSPRPAKAPGESSATSSCAPDSPDSATAASK